MAETSKSEREFISMLINLYRDLPELWKVKSKDYFNQTKKQLAFKKIHAALVLYKPDFTIEKIKKKINILRTNFNKDYKAIESAKRAGASTDAIPTPKAWYFEEMMFIKDQMAIAISTPQRKRSKKSLENRTEELVGLASEYFKKPETEADIIAKGWALKLNRLAADQKRFAEKIINDTLFEAENGSLTKHGVHFLTSNNSFVQENRQAHYSYAVLQPTPLSSNSTSPSPTYGHETQVNISAVSQNYQIERIIPPEEDECASKKKKSASKK